MTVPRVFTILMALLLVATIGISGCAKEEAKPSEAVFGALVSLTGDFSTEGERSKAALEIAVEDVNKYLLDAGANKRIRIVFEDTETESAVALTKLKSLAEQGVKVVFGPQTSESLKEIKAFAEENNILLISNSSTAPSLAIPGDNVFRFCPNDFHQAEALSKLIWHDGIRAIITVWRGDVWGDDLSQALKDSFEELGGTVLDGVRYNPTTSDFSAEMESLGSKIIQGIAQYDAAQVAVVLDSFEEVVPIFLQAQDYPVLSTVKWYGSDSTALDKGLVNNAQAAKFAVETGFPNPLFGEEEETGKDELIREKIQAKIGSPATSYSVAAYDSVWVATLAYLAAGTADDNALSAKAITQIADSYYGATGWTTLDEAGDRKLTDYDFWAVREEDGVFQWKRVARYQIDAGMAGRLITDIEH